MKPTPAQYILLIGQYPQLVSTRAELLRSCGYGVVEAKDIDRAVKEFTSREFSTVVLCQSLSLRQCEHLAPILRSIQPDAAIVVLGHYIDGVDVALDAPLDPKSFLNSIAAIMARKTGIPAMVNEEN